ncbi:MAG: hypothetical protein LBS82_06140 [Spirochaetaceae bacterium]|nr:hypothetical protein [Spirochaetaceae bacterium]
MAGSWHKVLSEIDPGQSGEPKTNAAVWGIPAGKTEKLGAELIECVKLLKKLGEPTTATKVVRFECNVAFALMKATMRSLHANFYQDEFPKIALYRLGLRPHGEGGGEDEDEGIEFFFKLITSGHIVMIVYRIAGSPTRGKGSHHAAEIRFWVLPLDDPAPPNANAPGWKSFTNTASPWVKTFGAEDIGKRLYVAMRWQEDSVGGEDVGKGPWSVIQSIIIP